MVRPTVLPSYRPNGRWDGSAVGHQAHAFHFLFEGVGRIYGSQIHGTQCRGPDIVCHGSRVLELADQRLVVGSPWRGPASWQAIGWHGWPLFETWQSSPWLGSVSFFFYFKQPSKLGLGPGLGQVVTWVRLVRVVAVTRALALRFFCRRPTSLSPGKPDGSGRSCFRAPIQRGADGPHSVKKIILHQDF